MKRLFFIFIFCTASLAAYAQNSTILSNEAHPHYPRLTNDAYNIFDFAEVIGRETTHQLNNMAYDTQRASGVVLKLLTIKSLESMHAKKLGLEKFAQTVFNKWNVAEQSPNQRVLLTYDNSEQKLVLSSTENWLKEHQSDVNKIIHQDFSAKLKKQSPGKALIATTETVLIYIKTGELPGGGFGFFHLLLVIILIGLLVWWLKKEENLNKVKSLINKVKGSGKE